MPDWAGAPARLSLDQHLAAATSGEELGQVVGELGDRIGPPPEAAQNLLFLVGLRLQAGRAGVGQVTATEGESVVKFREPTRLEVERLSREVGAPLRVGSNQFRLPRGRGQAWLASLQRLIDLLPAA